MKRVSIPVTAALVLVTLTVVHWHTSAVLADEHEEEGVASKSRVASDKNGAAEITLDAQTRGNLAIEVRAAEPASMLPETRGFGRVVDPAPLIELTADVATARVALEGAARELQRVQALAKEQNASARSLEAAQLASAQAKIAFDAARAKLLTSFGSRIADRDDLADLSQSLASGDSALVRIDLPAGDRVDPTAVRLLTVSQPAVSVAAELIGPAPSVDPQLQGSSFLALVTPNAIHLAPGQAVAGFLARSANATSGVVVPRSAVVRSGGGTWIYVALPDNAFVRRAVVLDVPTSNGWFVSSGVSAGDEIVVTGAQMLLSEELKSSVKDTD